MKELSEIKIRTEIRITSQIQLNGLFKSLHQLDPIYFTPEYFSFFQYNSSSRINYDKDSEKKGLKKDIKFQTKLDLARNENHFFVYPLSPENHNPFENNEISKDFSFLSLIFDELADNNLINSLIEILTTIKNHFWRFQENARWENIQKLITESQKIGFNPVGVICVNNNFQNLRIFFFNFEEKFQVKTYKIIDMNPKSTNITQKECLKPVNLTNISFPNLIKSINMYENINKWRFYLWGEKDFEITFKNKNPQKDTPILNFIANLLNNNNFNAYLESDIQQINNFQINIHLNFDVLAYNHEKIKCIECKQKFDEEKKDKESNFLKFLGRVMLFHEILQSNGCDLKIQGYFLTTGKKPIDWKYSERNLEIVIISNEEMDEIFSFDFLN
ncbi:hypothetical protein [Candidatus Harpocratesius sp.]